jgi:hypothetical protein
LRGSESLSLARKDKAMKRLVLILVLAVTFAYPCYAQRRGGRGALFNTLQLRLEFSLADGVSDLTPQDVSAFLREVAAEWSSQHPMSMDSAVEESSFVTGSGGIAAATALLRLNQANSSAQNRPLATQAPEIRERLSHKFEEAIEKTVSLPADQRQRQLRQIDEALAPLTRRIGALNRLIEAKGAPTSLLAEKLQQLRAEAQRLELERNAKNARRTALTDKIREREALAQLDAQRDIIVQELHRLVALREADLAQQKAKLAAGAAVEVSQAEAALAEARIRLAEREAGLGKAGKGELLDRLTDELAMVSVDAADIEIQLKQVQEELRAYRVDKVDPAALDQLIARDPLVGPQDDASGAYQLLNQTRQEIHQLEAQRLALKVISIKVAPIEAPSPTTGAIAP